MNSITFELFGIAQRAQKLILSTQRREP